MYVYQVHCGIDSCKKSICILFYRLCSFCRKNMYRGDLCSHVIWLKFGLGYHHRDIAIALQVSLRTVYWILKKFTSTGRSNCERVGRTGQSSLHIHEQFILM